MRTARFSSSGGVCPTKSLPWTQTHSLWMQSPLPSDTDSHQADPPRLDADPLPLDADPM